jgi:S-ribosylhomocysteine lyase LuxS involved in autoinducer biosynthesis
MKERSFNVLDVSTHAKTIYAIRCRECGWTATHRGAETREESNEFLDRMAELHVCQGKAKC